MPASTWSTTDKSGTIGLTGTNLIATATGAGSVRGKDPKRAGKYYIEYTSTTTQATTNLFGFGTARTPLAVAANAASFCVAALAGANAAYDAFGVQITGLGSQSGGVTTSTLLCAAIDLDNARIWFRISAVGNWNNAAANNPATGVGGLSLSGTGLGQGIDAYPFAFLLTSTNSITANFGGSAFTGTVPSGFTSGWDDTVTALSNMVATQVAIEHWGVGTPAMQLTQIAIEEWATVAAAPAVTRQARAMVMA
jgi:hypothetical protein